MTANDAVALARGGFQALSLEDADSSVAARDQALALERPEHDRDSRAMHTKHHRKKFLFEQEGIVINAIVRLQQPSAAPLGHVVQRVARGALHDLQQIRLSVETDDIAKWSCARGLLDESRGRHRRKGAIGDLLECPANSVAVAQEEAYPEHAFAPDGGNFHLLAVLHFVGDGEDTAVREVDVFDPHTVRLQDFAGGHGSAGSANVPDRRSHGEGGRYEPDAIFG